MIRALRAWCCILFAWSVLPVRAADNTIASRDTQVDGIRFTISPPVTVRR